MKYAVLTLLAAAAITTGTAQHVHAQVLDLNPPSFNLDQYWQDYLNSLNTTNPNLPNYVGQTGNQSQDQTQSCGCGHRYTPPSASTPTPTPTLTSTPTPTETPITVLNATPTPTPVVTPTPTPTPTATSTPTPTPSPTASPVVSKPVLTVLPATGAGDAATVVSGVFAGLSALAHVVLRRK